MTQILTSESKKQRHKDYQVGYFMLYGCNHALLLEHTLYMSSVSIFEV